MLEWAAPGQPVSTALRRVAGAPVHDRSSEHRPQAAGDIAKAINVFKTDGGTGGVSKTSQQGKNEAGS